ncbi:hypothetical protein BDV37DRAFT_249640 [Aspergillus pseudonomiae]|uniref:Uncharacterized protein n=1 Tax=Aspergillus pseudonomiae TaxID=1506151 RepID=A0A5N7DBU1_9EURO|nr:uncharacterized protein BDV37DRAFT_249640 [Aspergillus pseudonomiae]KAE8403694.1 hypothetical protein BDV37DRAFT_249640 [Aspergillus pseudonomiae]
MWIPQFLEQELRLGWLVSLPNVRLHETNKQHNNPCRSSLEHLHSACCLFSWSEISRAMHGCLTWTAYSS